MKLFLLISSLASCLVIGSFKDKKSSKLNVKPIQLIEDVDRFDTNEDECDSLKFPDFKSNLREVEMKIRPEFLKEIDSIAQKFILQKCKEDSLFCDKIIRKDKKHYASENGYGLFSFAYIFKNSVGLDKESASFFVFGIRKNGKTIFYDVAEDLMGEIKLNLEGFEKKKGNYIIWGEMNPYFGSEYGKFRLRIENNKTEYEFSCHSDTH